MRASWNAGFREVPPSRCGGGGAPERTGRRRPLAKAALWIAALALAAALPADAATFSRRSIELAIEEDSLTERQLLELELESKADLETWSSFSFVLDERTVLVAWKAEVVDRSGRTVFRSGRDDLRERLADDLSRRPAGGNWSARFERLEVGHTLRIRLDRRHTPPFPAYMVRLALDTPQDDVRVTVRGGDGRLRFKLTPDDRRFTVTEQPQGIEVAAKAVGPVERKPFMPADDSGAPMLRVAWDRAATWRSVGEWYTDIVGERPPLTPEIRQRARQLAAGSESKRDALIAIADFVKHEIGYEAGGTFVGGWRPSPPAEVLDRGRGDCKDKAELLRALLLAAGIESHLALMRLGHTSLIPVDFPSNLGFDHTVVAVPAAAVEAAPDDPVVEGLLLVDPTMDRGHALWLSPFNQGQVALVAAGATSRLLHIPVRRDTDLRLLVLEGALDRRGRFSGAALLRMTGTPAIVWLRDTEREEPARVRAMVRQMLQQLLGRGEIREAGWEILDGPGPAVELTAAVELSGLVAGPGGFRELRFPMLDNLPDPRLFLQRRAPAVLSPRTDRTLWRLQLPPGWCPPGGPDERVENASGSVSRAVSAGGDGGLSIDRAVVLDRWWFEADSIDELRRLAEAEDRVAEGSFQLACFGGP
jgi:hypothetical protein